VEDDVSEERKGCGHFEQAGDLVSYSELGVLATLAVMEVEWELLQLLHMCDCVSINHLYRADDGKVEPAIGMDNVEVPRVSTTIGS